MTSEKKSREKKKRKEKKRKDEKESSVEIVIHVAVFLRRPFELKVFPSKFCKKMYFIISIKIY